MIHELRRETLVAIDAVRHALTIAQAGAGVADVSAKEERDVVTTADLAVEDAVRDIVARALSVAVVGEERGGEAAPDGHPWTVDSDSFVAAANGHLHAELLALGRSG